jgi:hypothetical protein
LYFLKGLSVATAVRMMLAGQPAISTFNVFGGSVAINAQGLVWILHKKKKQTA